MVIGCGRQPRGRCSPYCERHYYRLYKRGLPTAHPRGPVAEPEGARKPPKERYTNSNGYVRLRRPGHALADRKGYVYEHRLVLYDKLDGALPVCHWCTTPLTWKTVQPDHLDDVKTNNDPDNLVPSCGVCNRRRGLAKSVATKRAQREAKTT